MDSINLSLSKMRALTMLTNQGYARVMQAVVLYASCGQETQFSDPTQAMAFSLLAADVEDVAKKHSKSVSNGRKGGRPKKVVQITPEQEVQIPNENADECAVSQDESDEIDIFQEEIDFGKKATFGGVDTTFGGVEEEIKTSKTSKTQVSGVFQVFSDENQETEERETEKESGVKKKNKREKDIYTRTRGKAENLARVIPPTLDMVTNYCRQCGYDTLSLPQRFIDYYGSNGWRVGKNKMVDWHHAMGTWISNKNGYNTGGPTAYSRKNGSGGYSPGRVDDDQPYNPYADLPRL